MAARRLGLYAIAACAGLATGAASADPARHSATLPPPPDIPAGANFDAVVRLLCTLQADASVTACVIASEEPMGQGLGERALQIAPTLRMHLRNANGTSAVGERVFVPVHFIIAPAEGAPSP
jgi:hypothetical protein